MRQGGSKKKSRATIYSTASAFPTRESTTTSPTPSSNRQKTNYYLLMMPGEKVFKTKDLSKQLGVARLSFASPEDMLRLLNITPGSVSVLGLMNDKENEVQLVIDKPVLEDEKFGCHPVINSSTLAIATKDLMEKILPAVHHAAILVELPEEAAEA